MKNIRKTTSAFIVGILVATMLTTVKASAYVGDKYTDTVSSLEQANKISVQSSIGDLKESTIRVENFTTDYTYRKNVPLSADLQRYIEKTARQANVDVRVVYAIMNHESGFLPYVISPTNDYGLMQINICHQNAFARLTGTYNMLDPYANVLYGINHLKELYGYAQGVAPQYKLQHVLMCYQYGVGGSQAQYNQGIYSSEFTNYVQQMMYNY